jgi:dodecin
LKYYQAQKKVGKMLQKKAVAHAAKSFKNIRSVYVQDQSASIKDNEVAEFKVNLKITFVIE